jgi:exopolyphosphatase / guanosine-5'-triphosphate,3'-diphosphate pyrophosphatase
MNQLSEISYPEIIPRWEWRTFGITQKEGEEIFSDTECYRTLKSKDIYIISELSNDNIKLRDSKIIDMKLPLKIDHNSLELWTVALKATFPISLHNMGLLFKGLGKTVPSSVKEDLSTEEFLSIINKLKDLHIVTVDKTRHGFRPNEVRSELAEIVINKTKYFTVSFESDNPSKVRELIEKHSLTSKKNENYIYFLKKLHNLIY